MLNGDRTSFLFGEQRHIAAVACCMLQAAASAGARQAAEGGSSRHRRRWQGAIAGSSDGGSSRHGWERGRERVARAAGGDGGRESPREELRERVGVWMN